MNQGDPKLTEQVSSANTLPTEPEFHPPLDSPQSGPNIEPPTEDVSAHEASSGQSNLTQIVLHVGALVVAAVITIGLFLLVDQETIRKFQDWGYFGIFLTSLIGNASIALPIPSLFFTFVGGGTFNWLVVGLVSGVGEALGESTGYLAGYGGSAIIEDKAMYKKMQGYMAKYGGLTIFALSVFPNPLFDLAGIAAGASHFGYFRFLVYCWVGKTIKTTVFALAGAYSVTWLLDYFQGFMG